VCVCVCVCVRACDPEECLWTVKCVKAAGTHDQCLCIATAEAQTHTRDNQSRFDLINNTHSAQRHIRSSCIIQRVLEVCTPVKTAGFCSVRNITQINYIRVLEPLL